VPAIAHCFYRVELVIYPKSERSLSLLRTQPSLLLCNHPTFQDPLVIFLLSARLGYQFNYLAAYEQFQGLWRWIFQWGGAYSVRRGLADRDSIAQSLQLMASPNCRLVIFPEGGCSLQNDTIMPFRPGAIQMAMQAMTKRIKQGETIPDFYVFPVSIKYRYTQDMSGVIDQTLRQLETKLQISQRQTPPLPSASPYAQFYQRLRKVSEQVLLKCEQEFQIVASDPTDWNQRIPALKATVLQQCEQTLGLTPAPHDADRERVYRILNALESRQSPTTTETWDAMNRLMVRFLNFEAIYDGYVAAYPTPERFLDTLIRLEREVFAIDEQPPPKGFRQAIVWVGEPIDLKDHYTAYVQNRTATIDALTQEIRTRMQDNLTQLAKESSNL
jgi:1-acyl-sn-glycerol-3-phosphate acyltransferase